MKYFVFFLAFFIFGLILFFIMNNYNSNSTLDTDVSDLSDVGSLPFREVFIDDKLLGCVYFDESGSDVVSIHLNLDAHSLEILSNILLPFHLSQPVILSKTCFDFNNTSDYFFREAMKSLYFCVSALADSRHLDAFDTKLSYTLPFTLSQWRCLSSVLALYYDRCCQGDADIVQAGWSLDFYRKMKLFVL